MQLGTVYSSYDVNRAGAEPVPGFRLVQRIGRGRIGEVWKAEAAGGFQVALKLIRISEGNGGMSEMRALEVTREVRHPNVIVCFGAWMVGDFLIIGMELADRTLWDRFQEATARGEPGIPRDELMGYMDEAARGIDFLNEHTFTVNGREQAGIQHRDIKPQNILLFGGGVKVADLGMARATQATMLSETASCTLAYSAPEFFRRKAARQSDQYSLAITYCHLRGGRVPFTGCAEEVMMGHLNDPPDLSMLPAEERPAVARALAKKPSDRWPTCRAFVDALRDAVVRTDRARRAAAPRAEAPLPARVRQQQPDEPKPPIPAPAPEPPVLVGMFPPAPETEPEPMIASRPSSIIEGWAAAGILGVIGLVLLGARATTLAPRRPEIAGALRTRGQQTQGLAAFSTPSQRASVDPVPEVVPPRTEILADPIEHVVLKPLPPARSATSEAVTLLTLPDDLFVHEPAAEVARPVVIARPARFVPPPREQNVTTASITHPLPVAPALAIEAPRAVELRAGDTTAVRISLRRQAVRGPVAVRLDSMPRGVSMSPAMPSEDSGEMILNLSASPDVVEGDQQVKLIASAGPAQAATSLTLRLRPSLAVAHLRQASSHFEKGQLDQAIAEASEAIRLAPSLATGHCIRALAHHKKGNLDAAIADYTQALRLDPDDPTACNNRGLAYREKGLYFKAIADYGEAIRLKPDDPVVRYNRAMAYMYAGDDLSAIADFSQAIKLRPSYSEAYQHRGDAFTRRGELERARIDYGEAHRLRANPVLPSPIGPIGMQNTPGK